MKLTPLLKGLITGVLIVALNLTLLTLKTPPESWIHFVPYILYAGGIAWAILGFYQSPAYIPKFGSIFGQGFRCFIIVTLVYVAFIGIYTASHPEMATDAAKNYVLNMKGKKLPADLEKEAEMIKKQFVTVYIYSAIVGSLIAGTIFTAAGAGLLLTRKK